MTKYYYDLHIHSCLSPCGDNDSTPCNLAGMAKLSGLDIAALTDHNTCKNCPAFFTACEYYGIIPVAGMELTTAEDIHLVCLFPTLESAMCFGEEIDSRRIKIENRTSVFGNQLILGNEDTPLGEEPYLLINATSVALDEAPRLTEKYGGICYPAHIDREGNGIIATLGTMPDTPRFSCVELHDKEKAEEYITRFSLEDKTVIISSDAHRLADIPDAENFLVFSEGMRDSNRVRAELIKLLRGEQ